MLRVFLIAISFLTIVQAADDYFPTAKGNKWCFSKFDIMSNENGGYDTINAEYPTKREFSSDTVVNGVTFYRYYKELTPGVAPESYDDFFYCYITDNRIRQLRADLNFDTAVRQMLLLVPSRVGDTLKSAKKSDDDSTYHFYTVLENGTDSVGAGKFTNTKAAICSVASVFHPSTDSAFKQITYDKYVYSKNVGLIRHIHYVNLKNEFTTNEMFTLDSFSTPSTKSIIPFTKSLRVCEQIILSGNGFLYNSKDYDNVPFTIYNSAGQQIIRTSISPNSYIPFQSLGLNTTGNYILSTGKSSVRYILQKN